MVWYFCQNAGLKLKFWTTSWKVEKMDKCVAFPVVSPTFCSMSKYVFETSWNTASCRYLRFARPYSTSAVNPNQMDSCVWNIPNTFETNLSIQKKKLGGAVVKRNTFTMRSITFLRYIEKMFVPLPSPQKQNRFKSSQRFQNWYETCFVLLIRCGYVEQRMYLN